MNFVKTLLMISLVTIITVSCKPSAKSMTPEDFLKIENEVLNTDRKPESIETIAGKYGYTLEEYTNFENKIEKDPELKKKVGELILNSQKGGK